MCFHHSARLRLFQRSTISFCNLSRCAHLVYLCGFYLKWNNLQLTSLWNCAHGKLFSFRFVEYTFAIIVGSLCQSTSAAKHMSYIFTSIPQAVKVRKISVDYVRTLAPPWVQGPPSGKIIFVVIFVSCNLFWFCVIFSAIFQVLFLWPYFKVKL